MARTVRDSKLDSRTARLKLAMGVRHWRQVSDGLTLVYRRTGAGYGTWFARYRDRETDKVVLARLGAADDHMPADGESVLTFAEAQQKAMTTMQARATRRRGTGYTVSDACADYLEWYGTHRKATGLKSTRYAINLHIDPVLGPRPVSALTVDELRKWHRKLATAAPRVRSKKSGKIREREGAPDQRARKATANRILTILCCCAFKTDQPCAFKNDQGWKAARLRATVDKCSHQKAATGSATLG
ncbi:MAG: hypothetical protein HY943_20320 [Gammaproteobacteria bacterium]|nr:hypothetical protein [Gammaproteobacteria bacterium]